MASFLGGKYNIKYICILALESIKQVYLHTCIRVYQTSIFAYLY